MSYDAVIECKFYLVKNKGLHRNIYGNDPPSLFGYFLTCLFFSLYKYLYFHPFKDDRNFIFENATFILNLIVVSLLFFLAVVADAYVYTWRMLGYGYFSLYSLSRRGRG